MRHQGSDNELAEFSNDRWPYPLNLLRGSNVRVELPVLPPVPSSQIESIQEPKTRQRAWDAWNTAYQLVRTLWIWALFLSLQDHGASIDDDTQNKLSDVYPETENLRRVLETIAFWRGDRSEPPRNPADPSEVISFIIDIHKSVLYSLEVLDMIGIRPGPEGLGVGTWSELASGVVLTQG
jgi:hypothetical protein